jgi:hypothetical protein
VCEKQLPEDWKAVLTGKQVSWQQLLGESSLRRIFIFIFSNQKKVKHPFKIGWIFVNGLRAGGLVPSSRIQVELSP